ncbi:MAG: hypothetical protein F6K41_06580 [Symploca sp. SIO3E6]|nr:hypothetical protein [Caldora sp. SIO3E6]
MLNSQEILAQRYQLQQQLGRTAAGRQTWLATDLHSSTGERKKGWGAEERRSGGAEELGS